MENNIIYLAAGQSRRFGANKLLWKIDGKPMFAHTLDLLLEIVAEKENFTLTVVTMYDEIAEYVEKSHVPRVRCVISPESVGGVSFSIKNGIKDLPDKECYYTFVVADEPRLTYGTLMGFMEGCIASGCMTGEVVCKGVGGNPAMFHASLKDKLMALAGDRGGRAVLKEYKDSCFRYEVTFRDEIEDIDLPLHM